MKTIEPDEAEIIFTRLSQALPKPETELNFHNSYTLLVAVTLSAQATDISVNKATDRLFKCIKTPRDMLEFGENNLRNAIKSIGLFNTKAKNIIQMANRLIKDFNGQVPETRKELESLPGVGRKTANVVLNVAFDQPTCAVDTHIFRVSNRLGLAPGNTPLAVEKGLYKIIPPRFLKDAHHWLILHGRYTCVARKPRCHSCTLVDICRYPDKHFSA